MNEESKLPDNCLALEVIEQPGTDDFSVNSVMKAQSGEMAANLLILGMMNMLDLAHMGLSAGIRISDVHENSRLKAIDEAEKFAKVLIEEASTQLRTDLINPDNRALEVKGEADEADVPENSSGTFESSPEFRLHLPDDLMP